MSRPSEILHDDPALGLRSAILCSTQRAKSVRQQILAEIPYCCWYDSLRTDFARSACENRSAGLPHPARDCATTTARSQTRQIRARSGRQDLPSRTGRICTWLSAYKSLQILALLPFKLAIFGHANPTQTQTARILRGLTPTVSRPPGTPGAFMSATSNAAR